MKRAFALLLAVFAFGAIAANAGSVTINGWISDSKCGAKHTGTGAECVKKCIESGMEPVFVDEEKKQVWAIDNPASVKNFYGAHVNVTATMDKSKKTIHIESVMGQ